jgi:hypothetical protein
VRTTVSIDDAVLEKAKQQAQNEGVTLGAIVDRALRQSLLEAASRKGTTSFRLLTYANDAEKPTDLSVEEIARLRDADSV